MNGNKVDDELVAEVLARWAKIRGRKELGKYEMYTEIARHTHLQVKTVAGIIYRHRPTVNLAQAKIRAAAVKMAERIIEKANVSEAIDVLSRTNIGVLSPAKTGGNGGGGAFFLSVQADSCGAVKVGLAAGDALGLPAATEEGVEDAFDEGDEPDRGLEEYRRDEGGGPPAEAGSGGRPQYAAALDAAKAKLARARGRLQAIPEAEIAAGGPDDPDTEDGGLQELDGGAEAEGLEEV